METVEFTLPAKLWLGLNTKYPADTKLVDSDQFTAGSFNLVTDRKGVITKRPGGVFYNATPFPLPPKDQYEAVFSSGIRHLLIMEGGNLRYSSGGGTFSLVTSGYAATGNMEFATYKNRVYFGNGIDDPQVYDTVNSYGGVSYTVPQTRDQGAFPPLTAPTFAADTAGGAVPAGAHTYKVTFLYTDSEESNGGPASGVHTVANPNNTVNLTALPIGTYGVTARKIYRDNNDGNWLLVGTVSNNTATTFSDTLATGTLPIPTNNGLPPKYSLIVSHRDRLWVAGVTDSPSNIYWSEAGQPNIFFVNNTLLCNPRDPITGLAVYNDRVIVFNRNSMGQILGTTAANFTYSEISPSVGCADGRSIATRTIRGVPKLVWLAGNDMYEFNGSSITVISDEINDQFEFNIQQALQVKGRNTQSTQADFLAGVASPGIELSLNPGVVTTKGYTGTTNPTKLWDSEPEWENNTQNDNIATNDGSNTLKAVTQHTPAFAAGSHNNTVEVSNTLRTPTTADYTGEAHAGGSYNDSFLNTPFDLFDITELATPFIPTRSGSVTGETMEIMFHDGIANAALHTHNWEARIYGDSGGTPGGLLGSAAFSIQTFSGDHPITLVSPSMGVSVTAGARYWMAFKLFPAGPAVDIVKIKLASGWSGGSNTYARGPSNVFAPVEKGSANGPIGSAGGSVTIVSNALASSGIWTGPTYDSFAVNAVANGITHAGSYPSGSSAVTTIEATNDPTFTTGIISQSFNSLNGTGAISLGGKRYWRIKIQLSAPDNRFTAIVGQPTLTFVTTATWISEVIDHTTDIVSYDLLQSVSTIPGGTSVTVTIATSPDNITYTPFTTVGSVLVQRYSKIRIVLTTTGDNVTTPVVSTLLFNWTLMSNLVSQVIDTGATPAGWELFQTDFSVNGGTVLFEMRTAASVPGLTGATWFTVTNGAFITAPVNQYAQWRVTLTSHANQVPVVESVTVNWLIQDVASIRVASLFYNKQYFLAAAEFGQTVNNLVFMYDENNTWKIFRGLNINTMGTFFNDAYYGSSTVGQMVKWLDPQILTDQGTNIELDVRTKAFSHEIGDETKAKIVRQMVLKIVGTGATVAPFYSMDNGTTFIPMLDIETGLPYYESNNDGRLVTIRFSALSGTMTSGRTIMFRLHSEDENMVEIHSLRAKCWISPREVLHG